MFLKRLAVENLGGIRHTEIILQSNIAQIKCDHTDEISFAIETVFACFPSKDFSPPVRAGKNSMIHAETVIKDRAYKVYAKGIGLDLSAETVNEPKEATEEYLSHIKRCAEENRLCRLDKSFGTGYHGPTVYLNEDKYFKPGELCRITDGIGTTCSFRSCLKRYLETDSITCASDCGVLSHFDTVRFWDSFGKIRDPHYEGKPLLIINPTKEIKNILENKPKLTDRQIIFVYSDETGGCFPRPRKDDNAGK